MKNTSFPAGLLPFLSLAQLSGEVKTFQLSTHSHRPMPSLAGYERFKNIGHRDFVSIKPGGSFSFPQIEGPGIITALWLTFVGRYGEIFFRRKVPAQKKLWLKIYFDQMKEPAVNSPLADFFGQGTERYVHFTSLLVGMSSGGYYAYFPMPFYESARVEIENRSQNLIPLFYSAITYLKLEHLPSDLGYFYARYRQQEFLNSPDISGSRVPNQPYVILEEKDQGHYLGTTLTISPTHWLKSRFKPPYFLFPYLEGNLKVYIDDEEPAKESFIEKPPGAPLGEQSLEYTGVEDYFNSGWYYVKGSFAGPLFGCPYRSLLSGVVSQYRFHIFDRISWKKKILITLTHGEFDQIDCKMESVAYYYKKPSEKG